MIIDDYIFYTKDKHPEQKQGEKKKKKKKTGTPVSSSVVKQGHLERFKQPRWKLNNLRGVIKIW